VLLFDLPPSDMSAVFNASVNLGRCVNIRNLNIAPRNCMWQSFLDVSAYDTSSSEGIDALIAGKVSTDSEQ
jgi:hypothetical protein